jgi:hypothetical protein
MDKRETMHKMQQGRLVFGIKPKPKRIADDTWGNVLITYYNLSHITYLTLLVFRAYK